MTKRIALSLAACVAVALLAPTARAQAAFSGPVYPAPGGDTLNTTASGPNQSAADAAGETFAFSGIAVDNSLAGSMYWAPQAGSVQVSLNGTSTFVTLNYDPSVSNSTTAIWDATGVAYTDPFPGTAPGPVNVQLVLTSSMEFITRPAALSSLGAVVDVVAAGGVFSVTATFQAQYPSTSTTWVALNTLSQAQSANGTNTQSQFTGGFYFQAPQYTNAPALGTWQVIGLAGLLGAIGILGLGSNRPSRQGLMRGSLASQRMRCALREGGLDPC